MNQILQVQENKKKKTTNPIDTKKIVLFFVICIIIFGLIMLIEGIYSAYVEYSNKKVENPNNPINPQYITDINFTKTEKNKVIIAIESDVAISHIIYDWNGEGSTTIEENGKTNIEEIIDIPVGENILNVKVIDSNEKETKKSEKYIIEASKPIIQMPSVVGGQSIKVVVTSEVDLSYVTYKWNSEKEEKNDMIIYEDRTKFEKIIKIPKGQNTLKIIAVDINGNQSEASQNVEGVPLAETTTIARDGYIYFEVVSEIYDIETVEFELNNEKKVMNTDTFGKTKVVKWRVKMVEGWNYLKITNKLKYDKQDTTNSTYWKFEYQPQ